MKALDDLMHRCRHDGHTPTYADLVELREQVTDLRADYTRLMEKHNSLHTNARKLREQLAARVPDGAVLVDRGALNMTINVLRRDEANGMQIRGELADMLAAAPQPVVQGEQANEAPSDEKIMAEVVRRFNFWCLPTSSVDKLNLCAILAKLADRLKDAERWRKAVTLGAISDHTGWSDPDLPDSGYKDWCERAIDTAKDPT